MVRPLLLAIASALTTCSLLALPGCDDRTAAPPPAPTTGATSSPRTAPQAASTTASLPRIAADSAQAPFHPPFNANLLFISLDTTRADHLGCYGYARKTSPRIDELAAESHRFTRHFTVMPTTLPSHSAMFTSLYPAQLGVEMNGHVVPQQARTLAERLRDAGFATGAVVSAFPLDPQFGLNQGFDSYVAPPDRIGEWRGNRSRAEAARFIQLNSARRFFLWWHLFDPHTPYDPPPELMGRFELESRPLPPENDFLRQPKLFTPTFRRQCVNAYDAEIFAADREIGALLDFIEAMQLRDRTIVVFVTDHGETLSELFERYHYAFAHGEFLYPRELRVPLLIRLPAGFTTGQGAASRAESDRPGAAASALASVPERTSSTRPQAAGSPDAAEHAETVSTLDLLPTLLDLLGVPLDDAAVEGRSLVPLLRGDAIEPRTIVAQRHAFERPPNDLMKGGEHAVIDDGWLWIRSDGRPNELFDLQTDFDCGTNLLTTRPERAEEMQRLFREWGQAKGRALWGRSADPVDRRTRERLKQMGYLDDDQPPAAPPKSPSD